MSWFRRRPPVEETPPLTAEPLDVPDDLSSGSEARKQAVQALHSVIAEGAEVSLRARVLDRIVQENHIREYLLQAHGRT